MSMPDQSVLAVDVGGSHVKALLSTNPTELRRFVSGRASARGKWSIASPS